MESICENLRPRVNHNPSATKPMRLITTIKPIAIGIILGTLGSSEICRAGDKAEAKPSWKVSGELEEACSCRAACPCWFKSLPSRMTCDGMQVIVIDKGRYGKTSLDGLALGQFVQSPEHKTMFESFGNWNIDYVYIDEKANEEQRAALQELAQHFFPQGGKERKYRF